MRSCHCTYELSVAALVEVRSGPREHGVVFAMGSIKYGCVLVIVSQRYIFIVLLTFLGGRNNYCSLEMPRKEWQVYMEEQNCIGERGKRKS